jgi:acetyltransferase-like isoleucine patch superfamily enzyme
MLFSWIRIILRNRRLRRRFPSCVIYQNVSVDAESTLGDSSVIFKNVSMANSHIDSYSYVQCDSVINNTTIGAFCSIAGRVTIGLAAHPTFMVSTSPVFYDNTQPLPKFFVYKKLFEDNLPKTIIGADVWIGQGVMIKAGVKIGVGAVIGAGSVVTKDIPPYTIAVGTPCRPIRLRFNKETCQSLLISQWWTFDEVKLKALAVHFQDPEEFCRKVSELSILES